MKHFKLGRLVSAVLAVAMVLGMSVPAYAATQMSESNFVIKVDDEVVDSDMSMRAGETVEMSVSVNSGSISDYDFEWSCSDRDILDIEETTNDNRKIDLTALDETTKTKLYLTVSRSGYEDLTFLINVRVKAGTVSLSLSHKNLETVSFSSKNLRSIDLYESSSSLEYRVFQAIYNSGKKITVNYPLTDDEDLTYVFDGSEMDPIDVKDFSKKVNMSGEIRTLSKTIRTKVEDLAKDAGVKTYKYGRQYLPLYIAASAFPAEATVVIDLDALNDDNRWAKKLEKDELYLYAYDKSKNTLTEVDSLDLYKSSGNDICFTTDHGGYFIFSVEDLSDVAEEDTGSSNNGGSTGSNNNSSGSAQYAIQIIAQTYYGTEASVKARANALKAQGLLAIAERKTSGKNAGRWALEISAQTHYGTLSAMSGKAYVVLGQGAIAYVELRK